MKKKFYIVILLMSTLLLSACSYMPIDTTAPNVGSNGSIILSTDSKPSDIENEIKASINDDITPNEEIEITVLSNTCEVDANGNLKAGECEVKVRATDEAGNHATDTYVVTVTKVFEDNVNTPATNGDYTQNELITVDPCSQSGEREENVKVDIGFDSSYAEREYYAYTNEYAQVVYVEAEELILQDNNEPMEGDGRYCSDEAKVPGTEANALDEGHIIADSLGGVSNAYNITPQESTLNRSGAQADMEEELRTALENGQSVTNFTATITYPDTTTQIPSNYAFTYEIDGEPQTKEFENGEDVGNEQTEGAATGDEPQFSSCSERKDNGYTEPIYEDDPKYEWYNDGDGDGIVCE